MIITIILSALAGLMIGFLIGRIVEKSEWKWFLRNNYADIAEKIIGKKEYWCD